MRRRQRSPFIAVAGLLGLTLVVLVLVLGSSSKPEHRIAFLVSDATNLVQGLQVRAAGQTVGQISHIETVGGGRQARVDVAITDDKVWPLPPDSTFKARFGGTVAYTGRYIQITRGRSRRPPFREGQIIPAHLVEMPVEVDQVVGIFGPRTRENLRRTVNAAGAALDAAHAPLRRALDSAPPAVLGAKALAQDVGAERTALATLVQSTDRVAYAANAANPSLGGLISDASATLGAISSESAALGRGLAELPATMITARRTLARADGTLQLTTDAAKRLSPGVTRLTDLTPRLTHVLRTIVRTGPDAERTLATVKTSSPAVDRVLRSATRLLPDLRSALEQATTQLRCVRPYAPELAGFFSTWTSFVADGDRKDKYARLYFGTYPYPNATPLTIPQAAKLTPSAFSNYAFPRAPGANVGQPWYQPGCGVTADGADPQKDPEALAVDPLSRNLLQSNPGSTK